MNPETFPNALLHSLTEARTALTESAHLTCVANDYGWDQVFECVERTLFPENYA